MILNRNTQSEKISKQDFCIYKKKTIETRGSKIEAGTMVVLEGRGGAVTNCWGMINQSAEMERACWRLRDCSTTLDSSFLSTHSNDFLQVGEHLPSNISTPSSTVPGSLIQTFQTCLIVVFKTYIGRWFRLQCKLLGSSTLERE